MTVDIETITTLKLTKEDITALDKARTILDELYDYCEDFHIGGSIFFHNSYTGIDSYFNSMGIAQAVNTLEDVIKCCEVK